VHEIHTQLRNHRSIRAYEPQPLDDSTVEEIVATGQAAATSSNLQATTVIHVTNPETRQRIAAVTGGQKQVTTAGAFLVWCADLNRSHRVCESVGGEMVSGMTEQFIIATVDVSLAAQNAVVAAEAMGLGICYIGAIRNDPQTVSDLLELPQHVYPVFGLCIGVPAEDPEVKPRLPLAAVLKRDVYTTEEDEQAIADYDRTMQDYYGSRSANQKTTTWSADIARLVGGERRPHMREYLAERGFEMR